MILYSFAKIIFENIKNHTRNGRYSFCNKECPEGLNSGIILPLPNSTNLSMSSNHTPPFSDQLISAHFRPVLRTKNLMLGLNGRITIAVVQIEKLKVRQKLAISSSAEY